MHRRAPAVLIALSVVAACSPQTRDRADATANSAATDARDAGRTVDRDTADARKSLKSAGHDLAHAADQAGDAAKRLVKKANAEMRADR